MSTLNAETAGPLRSTMKMDDMLELTDHVRFFSEFFSAKEDIYTEKAEAMISRNDTRLVINLNDLRDYNTEKTKE
jgi:hypothetical protein